MKEYTMVISPWTRGRLDALDGKASQNPFSDSDRENKAMYDTGYSFKREDYPAAMMPESIEKSEAFYERVRLAIAEGHADFGTNDRGAKIRAAWQRRKAAAG